LASIISSVCSGWHRLSTCYFINLVINFIFLFAWFKGFCKIWFYGNRNPLQGFWINRGLHNWILSSEKLFCGSSGGKPTIRLPGMVYRWKETCLEGIANTIHCFATSE
jgi:hypothetical protein